MSGHSVRVAGLTVLLLVSGGTAFGQRSQERLRCFSERFAIRTDQEGKETVAVLGEDGSVRASLPFAGFCPIFGAGSVYALLGDPQGEERPVRIIDSRGETVSQFGIAPDRTLTVGRQTLAVHPSAEHAAGTAFQIEFRATSGKSLLSIQREGLVLLDVEPRANEHWISFSVDRQGDHHVHHFDGTGLLLWEFVADAWEIPTVEVSPDGRLTLVGVVGEDPRVARLSFLDESGTVSKTAEVPAFRLALFDPGASHVLLGGRGFLGLVRVSDATLVWSDATVSLPLERPLCFSADGSRAFALTLQRTDGGESVGLIELSDLGGRPRATARKLSIAFEADLAVPELSQLPDGRLRIVTPVGVHSIQL